MHHRFLSWLLACVFLTSVALRAQTPAPAAATESKVKGGAELILVAKVTGTATMTVGGVTTPLAVGGKVPSSATIDTLTDSSVVLVFSNGATTQLGAKTEMVIEEFLQDPFATTIKMADITDEPSISTTKLKLNHGELVGKVAHLKHDQGSTFVIDTPVGAAGIRGTTFRLVFTPDANGKAFFQLSTVDGNVVMTGVSGSGTANVAVPQGQEISVDVDVTVNAQGQTVVTVLNPVTTTANITPTVAAQVTQAATEISTAVQQTVFTPPPAGGGTTGGTTSSTTTTTNTDGSKTTTTTVTSPEKFSATVTQQVPRVTSGDGQQ